MSLLGALLLLASPELPPTAVQVENLEAFARLYGYVRFFHPSDEASRVDWDKLAVYGAARARGAETASDLERALEEIFLPIAPTVRVFARGEDPDGPLDLWPEDTSELSVIAWQHEGVGLEARGTYDSIRTHRLERHPVAEARFGTITRAVPAEGYRGRTVRLRAAVRTAVRSPANQGRLWLRVDRTNGKYGFFDNMASRPIRSESWERFEIEGIVDDDAERIVFGGFLLGIGTVWLDAFELAVEGEDGELRSVKLDNGDFEAGAMLSGWKASSPGYLYQVDESGCYEGSRCVRIDVAYRTSPATLFDALPGAGEVTAANLGRNLRAEVPLALYGDGARTYGGSIGHGVAEEFLRTVEAVDMDDDPTSRRAAGVLIAWNVFQHFYPYFDVVHTDWPKVLTESLHGALDAKDETAFEGVLKRLLVELRDGHASVYRPGLPTKSAWLPFSVASVEDQVIVTQSTSPEVERGDVVVSLDGKPARSILEEGEALISGSPQWKRWNALFGFGRGPSGESVTIVVKRDAGLREQRLSRSRESLLPETRPDSFTTLADGIAYVDLTRAPFEAIRPHLEELAGARGVVFDMRGYPQSGNHEILRHLTDRPLHSAQWMVPQTIYPDGDRRVGYDTSGQWSLTALPPRFRGKIGFLTDAGAISYGETLMSIVEHYRLGEIVGQPTAGTNGNVNPFTIPGGYRISWTGMRVLKHDGSRHHLVGILPTIPVERTVEGVREGRDEILERALSSLR